MQAKRNGNFALKLAIVGPGRSGKDEAALHLSRISTLIYSRSTSEVIAPHAARRLGMTTAEAFATRHRHRDLWRAIGDELRHDDPAYLARETLRDGDLCVGVRSRREMEAVVAEGLVSLVIWVQRDVPVDPTLEFGSELADVVLENTGSRAALFGRLRRLSYALGILAPGHALGSGVPPA